MNVIGGKYDIVRQLIQVSITRNLIKKKRKIHLQSLVESPYMFLVSERKRNINPLLVAIDIWGLGLNSINIMLNEKGPQKISTKRFQQL